MPLVVPAGVPLRVCLTKRVSKRAGAPVEAKLLEPVYAFDRVVIPAGCKVTGTVSRLDPVPKSQRVKAVLNGDFTPLHIANVEFTSLELLDGKQIAVHTMPSSWLGTVVPLHPPAQKPQPAPNGKGGVISKGKQQAKDQVHAQIDRVKSIPDMVRAPGKKERAEDYLFAKLPYHPQYLRSGARFDAELSNPIQFGTAELSPASLALVGTQPPTGSVAHTRLITPLDSHSSQPSDKVELELTQPVFTTDHKLVLPQGTRLDGTVVLARQARWFHRAGRLRFNFQQLILPVEVAQAQAALQAEVAQAQVAPQADGAQAQVAPQAEGAQAQVAPQADAPPRPAQETLKLRTQATVTGVESSSGPVKVDSEGGVQAKESKTRFIGAAVAVLIARQSSDLDDERKGGAVAGQDANVGGRTVGGSFGFGLLGAAAAQSSRYVGAALGYYGMAWTVFSTVIARGAEVEFNKNAAIDISFNPRNAAGKKFLADATRAGN